VNMAKKTLKAGYESQDIALGLERELLSYKKNVDAIYYKIQAEEAAAVPSIPAASTSAMSAPAAPAPVAASAPVAAPAQSVSVPDKPIAPVDVIAVLVAVALKKSSDEIAKDQTIKALCGGGLL
jgi:3-oxoacyl-ACP reductase-like protein